MINITDVYDSKAVAIHHKSDKSNAIPYLGLGYFPNKRKTSIDLKWIKTASGLPVSLAPSNYDAKPTIRTRKGLVIDKQEMAFFRESMTISEKDRIELAKLDDCTSPFVEDVVKNIYNDVENLVSGADVVPERMRMQLLFPETGGPAIYIASNGVTYKYTYDSDGSWATKNRKDLSGTKLWSNPATSKPLDDIQEVLDKADEPIDHMLMSQATFNLLKDSEQVKSAVLAQNSTANIYMTAKVVKELIATMFEGLGLIIYKKKFKDETGSTQKFVPDGFVAFIPEGELGNTWFGMTPEELTKLEGKEVDVTILDSGVAVVVSTKYDSGMQTETTVAETLLPSYERMDSVHLLSVGTSSDADLEIDDLTITSVAGTNTGDTKITVSPALTSGNSYKYKVADNCTIPNYGANVKTMSAWDGSSDITAATNKEILIVEVDAKYKAVKAGIATVTAKA